MRRVVARVAVSAAGLVLIYVLAAGFLYYRIAERVLEVGTIAEVLSASEPADLPTDLGYRGDPFAAYGYAFEDIALESEIGTNPAWLVPPDATGREAAIYVHGIAGAREDGYRHLPMLRDAGLPVLLITYRNDPGAPTSPDGAYAFGLAEWRDLDAAAAWWSGRGVERLIVVGESMGGGIVGQWLAKTEFVGSVAGVALDSPALSFRRVVEGLVRARGLPLAGVVARTALVWQSAFGRRDMRAAEVEDVLEAFAGPVFLAHGTGDSIVPFQISNDLAERRAAATILFPTGADHLGSWAEDPAGYREAFLGFLGAALP